MVRPENVSWYFSYRRNGNGSCKMSKTNQQGRFGAYYCCASSSIILRTEIATWLVRIQIKIKPPYNLKDLGDKVVLFLCRIDMQLFSIYFRKTEHIFI